MGIRGQFSVREIGGEGTDSITKIAPSRKSAKLCSKTSAEGENVATPARGVMRKLWRQSRPRSAVAAAAKHSPLGEFTSQAAFSSKFYVQQP